MAKKIIITQATGEYLLRQDTLVRRDVLLSVVEQHDRLQRTLVTMLQAIGLQRVAAPIEDLRSYIARRAAEQVAKERVPESASPASQRHAEEP